MLFLLTLQFLNTLNYLEQFRDVSCSEVDIVVLQDDVALEDPNDLFNFFCFFTIAVFEADETCQQDNQILSVGIL